MGHEEREKKYLEWEKDLRSREEKLLAQKEELQKFSTPAWEKSSPRTEVKSDRYTGPVIPLPSGKPDSAPSSARSFDSEQQDNAFLNFTLSVKKHLQSLELTSNTKLDVEEQL